MRERGKLWACVTSDFLPCVFRADSWRNKHPLIPWNFCLFFLFFLFGLVFSSPFSSRTRLILPLFCSPSPSSIYWWKERVKSRADDVCVDKTVPWQSLPGHLGVTPSRGHSCTYEAQWQRPKLLLKSLFCCLWCQVNLLGWLQASSE